MSIQFKRALQTAISSEGTTLDYGQPMIIVDGVNRTGNNRPCKLYIGTNPSGSSTINRTTPPLWLVPVGTILLYASVIPPDDSWLLCNGQSVNRSTYAELYHIIGTTFGSSSSTTFNVPDMKGRVPIGAMGQTSNNTTDYWGTDVTTVSGERGDFPMGERGGEYFHKLSVAELPAHDHVLLWNNPGSGGGATGIPWNSTTTTRVGGDSGAIQDTGSNVRHSSVIPYTALAYIIKAY